MKKQTKAEKEAALREQFNLHVERLEALKRMLSEQVDEYVEMAKGCPRGINWGHCGSLDEVEREIMAALWHVNAFDDEGEFGAFIERTIDETCERMDAEDKAKTIR